MRITIGDRLLLQANAGRRHFINGELVEIKTIRGDPIMLADGRLIPAGYRTFTHGYATTSHAAQGKTMDEVLVIASSRSLPAVHRQQFYVSISRGRERRQIFTDDVEQLRSHVVRSNERLAAVEVVPRFDRKNFVRRIWQRGQRFLKHFRQRIAPTHSPRQRNVRIRNTFCEHQSKSGRSIHT